MKTHKNIFIAAAIGIIAAATPHAQGVVTWTAGAPGGSAGGSLDFDGTSFLDTGIAATDVGGIRPVATSSDYTISMWINSRGGANDKWFFGTGNQGIHLGTRNGGGADNTLSQGHWGADSDGTTQILADTWYHATFTYDADGGTGGTTGLQSIYLNGALQSSSDNVGPNNNSTNLILGARNNGANGWDGQIDDLAIWDSIVSDTDIAAIAGGTAADTLGAQAYWDFEDDKTGTMAAVSGAGGLGALDFSGITAIPEPSSLSLLLLGAVGLVRRKRA